MSAERGLPIREAGPGDLAAMRALFLDAVAGGDTLAPSPGSDDAEYRAYWHPAGARHFVAEHAGRVAGAYMLRPSAPGLGDHVANAGYIVDPAQRGRGIASALCAHSIATATAAGFRAMQFNFVVATNAPALHLWTRHGFAVVGRIPRAFRHATLGEVDVLVMHRFLVSPEY